MIARESLAWLREHHHANPDKPWLVYTSFSRPHFPLTAPKRFFDRYYPEGVTPPWVCRTGDSTDHPMTVGAIKGFRTDEIAEDEMLKARAAYFAAVDFLDEILGDFLALLDRDGFWTIRSLYIPPITENWWANTGYGGKIHGTKPPPTCLLSFRFPNIATVA